MMLAPVGTIFDLPMPMMFMCVVMMMSGEAKNGYDFPIIRKYFGISFPGAGKKKSWKDVQLDRRIFIFLDIRLSVVRFQYS